MKPEPCLLPLYIGLELRRAGYSFLAAGRHSRAVTPTMPKLSGLEANRRLFCNE